ncbi:hypothetical protein M514_18368 [Trichuris suis]|uniref:Reverse transcriptase domain-containing protein n=1 Tax=Trichuris suis TaxID=68888 RepID=A0A085NJ50_9BILA|nr:hypothetical protein M514_18368 [Trichuris suis]
MDKMLSLLNSATYVPIQSDPTPQTKTELRGLLQIFAEQSKEVTISSIRNRLYYVTNSACPELYGLPKVHKPGVPLRPVVCSVNSVTSQLCTYLKGIIQPLIGGRSSHVSKHKDFCAALKSIQISKTDFMVSYDVKDLFTSIPILHTVNILQSLLDSDSSLGGCNASYIGETGNTLLDRFGDHMKALNSYRTAEEELNGTYRKRRGRPRTIPPIEAMEKAKNSSADTAIVFCGVSLASSGTPPDYHFCSRVPEYLRVSFRLFIDEAGRVVDAQVGVTVVCQTITAPRVRCDCASSENMALNQWHQSAPSTVVHGFEEAFSCFMAHPSEDPLAAQRLAAVGLSLAEKALVHLCCTDAGR